jgi:hypothetical protein
VALLLIDNNDTEAVHLLYPRKEISVPPMSLNIRSSRILGFNADGSDSFETATTRTSSRADTQLDSLVQVAKRQALKTNLVLGAWSLSPSSEKSKAIPNAAKAIAQALMRPKVTEGSPSPLVSAWEKYIGHAVVPYDEALRLEKLAHAYKVLGPYITAWEQLISQKS